LSEIRTDTISAANGTDPVTLTKQSAAKAWVNFNGTGTVAVRDSQGVSGLVDNGTGDYTVNFTSNMANANYASPAQVGNSTLGRYGGLNDSDGKLVGSAIFYGFQTSAGTALDPAEYSISIHGDLA
jgi:hypothetical protein